MITAQDILESKVFDDVFKEIEADLWEQFKRADPTKSESLQGVSLRLWGLGQVRSELERRMTKGVETHINGRV
jgi:hypothetical protein